MSDLENNFVMLGPAGSGKGTQAELLAKKLNMPQISTGVIFREMRQEDSELGKKVRELIDRGILVPDEITNDIVAQRLEKPDCKAGFVLDGYPRNLGQAQFLETKKPLRNAIYVEVSDEECIKRISARRVCSKCKAGFNTIYIKPKKEGVCDKCGGELVMRDDDKPDSVKERLDIYHNDTRPLIDFYEKKNVLLKINGEQPIEKVFEEIINGLEPDRS